MALSHKNYLDYLYNSRQLAQQNALGSIYAVQIFGQQAGATIPWQTKKTFIEELRDEIKEWHGDWSI